MIKDPYEQSNLRPGRFRERDAERVDTNRQMQANKRDERAARRAYRDAMRKGDYRGAMAVNEDARRQGINFSGIKRAGTDYAKASSQVQAAEANSRYMAGQMTKMNEEMDREDALRTGLDKVDEDSEAFVTEEETKLRSLAETPVIDQTRMFGELDEVEALSEVSENQAPGAGRLGLRQRLAKLSPIYNSAPPETRERFNSIFDRLGIGREQGDKVLSESGSEIEVTQREAEEARSRLAGYDRTSRVREIREQKRRELIANLGGIRKARDFGEREGTRLMSELS